MASLPEGPGLALFAGYGIEIEYMIAARESLAVLPACDQLLKREGGTFGDVDRGEIAWSNELVLHVIELKTNGPAAKLAGLSRYFQREVRYLDDMLAELGGRLMPTAMHPWMDPSKDTRLWPHDYGDVYALFDAIFDCRGHGWSNLQSMHVNLPFSGDDELRRLHAAIRLVLPLLPGLAASSPIVEGRATGLCDNRLEFYRHNCDRLPSVTAGVVPEPIAGRADYQRTILDPIARDVAPHDPRRLLDPEWVNARGAIARFARDAVEIRVLDTQEHPGADLAVAWLTIAAVRELCDEVHIGVNDQLAVEQTALERAFLAAVREGERAPIDEPIAAAFGLGKRATIAEIWQALWPRALGRDPAGAEHARPIGAILERGPLARRILAALDAGRSQESVYRELCDCLREGEMFTPA